MFKAIKKYLEKRKIRKLQAELDRQNAKIRALLEKVEGRLLDEEIKAFNNMAAKGSGSINSVYVEGKGWGNRIDFSDDSEG